MHSCKNQPHYHLMIRLFNCTSGEEIYSGTLETEALYAHNIDEKYKAATVRDIINTWRDRRYMDEKDAVATVEWNGETLDPDMLIRDIEIDTKKIPLYIPNPNEPVVLRYWRTPSKSLVL
jgi:hypothetical protein